MKLKSTPTLLIIVALLTASLASFADQSTDGASLFLVKGELVLDEPFDGDAFDVAKWPATGHKGKAAGIGLDDGFFVYDSEKSTDPLKRNNLHHHFSNLVGDLVVQFRFLPGAGFNWMNIGFNDESGHCFVTKFATDKIYSYKYKEKNVRSFHEYVDLSGSELSGGNAYLITVEIAGEKVFVHIDDKHFLLGQNSRFRNPKRSVFLGFQGGVGKVDWIKVWKGKRIENPNVASWETKKAARPTANLDLDWRFKKDKLVADARMALKNDAIYQKLLQATSDREQQTRKDFPFFKSPRAKHKAQHKEALKAKGAYVDRLNELRNLENAELAYLYKRFPGIKPQKKKK